LREVILTEALGRELGIGLMHAPARSERTSNTGHRQIRIGLVVAGCEVVNAMKDLLEFYEMVTLNAAFLRDSEKVALLDAKRGLRLFARGMESFKKSSLELDPTAEFSLLAAWNGAQELPSAKNVS
jgi:hypothetical protein